MVVLKKGKIARNNMTTRTEEDDPRGQVQVKHFHSLKLT